MSENPSNLRSSPNSENKDKNQKRTLRKVLKWTGIGVLVLLVIAILIPILFKDKIKEMVLEEVNKTLTAKVSIEDIDLTLLRSFPKLTVQLENTIVTGTGDFEGIELINAKTIGAEVKLWDVIAGDKIAIKGIYLDDADIYVQVLKDGRANYDITIPDSVETVEDDTSNFELKLEKYTLSNTNIVYEDLEGEMYAEIKNLNHTGKGDLTATELDFETYTSMDELTYEMEGISYLDKVKTEADVNLFMEFTELTSKFTLRENLIKVNNLEFGIDGFYEMLAGYDQIYLKLNASKATFKDVLSLIPTFYQSGYEGMVAGGKLGLDGQVKGRMDDKNMPGWDFNLMVENASIKYPDLPGTIKNIQVKAGSKFVGGEDMDKMTVDVDRFHADFAGNILDATLKMRNPMTDPSIKSDIIAKVDLASLQQIIPMAENESYKGKLDADVHLDGRLSAIEKEKYEDFKAVGSLKLMDMIYKSPDYADPIQIDAMLFEFTPQNLALKNLNAKMGKSDFNMSGTIDNYIGYAFRDDLLTGRFALNSNYIDANAFMPADEEPAADQNQSETASAESSSEPFLVPGNVDFLLVTNIKKVRYDGMDIENITGNIRVKDEIAALDNLSMNMLGGKVGLTGDYSTVNPKKPAINMGYDLDNINVQELAKNFVSIETLAPVAKYTQGSISSEFTMKGQLKPSFEPIYNSLTGNGNLLTSSIEVSGFKPLVKLSEVLKMDKLKNQKFQDLKAKFAFLDGKINLEPFDVKMGKIITNIQGWTSFEQNISYDLLMNIPKEEIPGQMVQAAEGLISKANNAVPKLNVASLPAMIPVKVKMVGAVTDPKIETDFKEALLKASGNLKDNLVSVGKDLVNKGVDSVKNVANQKIDEVKEDLSAKKAALIADAQKQADKVKAEGARLAAASRAEGDKQAQALMNEAGSNPLKKKSAEIAGNKIRKEADEKAKKLESEASERSDKIMRDARERADNIK